MWEKNLKENGCGTCITESLFCTAKINYTSIKLEERKEGRKEGKKEKEKKERERERERKEGWMDQNCSQSQKQRQGMKYRGQVEVMLQTTQAVGVGCRSTCKESRAEKWNSSQLWSHSFKKGDHILKGIRKELLRAL